MGSERGNGYGHRNGRLWPFGPVVALLVSVAMLVFLVGGLALLKTTSDWPSGSLDSWVLSGAFVIGLVPLLLLVLDPMARRGGTVEVRGIKLVFAAVAQEQHTVFVPTNMAPPGLSIADSGGSSVIDALEQFAKHDVVVVDLEDGTAWWETRLAVVCAGAARLARPRAVVFVGIEKGMERKFQGWAEPSRLLSALRASDTSLRRALDDAEVLAGRWRLALLPRQPASGVSTNVPVVQALVPFNDPDSTAVQWIAFRNSERNDLAAEQILMNRLGPL